MAEPTSISQADVQQSAAVPGLFPDTPRVVFERNPLVEVICQIRFPPILRIATEPPASFQESIRGRYPLFEEERRVSVVQGLPKEWEEVIQAGAQQSSAGVRYIFLTEDQNWRVHLTRDFLALTSMAYRRWDEFREHFDELISALLHVYTPSFYTRIGLRYRNVIRPTQLGLGDDCRWDQLLKSEIVAELGIPLIRDAVVTAKRELVLELTGDAKVAIRHGLIVVDETNGEQQYVIDADFFVDSRTETVDAQGYLDRFHREAGNFFRWCIDDRLYDAMQPRTAV